MDEGTVEFHYAKAIPDMMIAKGWLGLKIMNTCKLAWRFLKQVVKDNRVNENVLAQSHYTKFMSKNLGTEFNVVDTYKELYSGNLSLLSNISTDSIVEIIHLLKREHIRESQNQNRGFGDKFIQLLGLLCVCHGDSLSVNQSRVFTHFLKDNADLLCTVERRGLEIWLSYRDIHMNVSRYNDEDTYTRLILKDGAETVEEFLYTYYVRCLELFYSLTAGRNVAVCDFLMSNSELGLGYKALLFTITNGDGESRYPYKLRALSLHLLVTLYMDREPNQPRPAIQQIRPLELLHVDRTSLTDIKEDAFSKFEEHRPEKGFVRVKEIVLDYLKDAKAYSRLSRLSQIERQNMDVILILLTPHSNDSQGVFTEEASQNELTSAMTDIGERFARMP